MDLVERWWNSQFGAGRRDIWLNSDGREWHVRALHGGTDGEEVHFTFAHEWEARAKVDRLIKARPAGRWKDITDLVSRPCTAGPRARPAESDEPS